MKRDCFTPLAMTPFFCHRKYLFSLSSRAKRGDPAVVIFPCHRKRSVAILSLAHSDCRVASLLAMTPFGHREARFLRAVAIWLLSFFLVIASAVVAIWLLAH